MTSQEKYKKFVPGCRLYRYEFCKVFTYFNRIRPRLNNKTLRNMHLNLLYIRMPHDLATQCF